MKRPPLFGQWRLLAQAGSRRFSLDSTGALCADSTGATTSTLSLHRQKGMPPFDEIVVRHAGIHLETIGASAIDVHLGHVQLVLWRDRAGKIRVRLLEGTVGKDGLIEEMTDSDVKRALATVGKRAWKPWAEESARVRRATARRVKAIKKTTRAKKVSNVVDTTTCFRKMKGRQR